MQVVVGNPSLLDVKALGTLWKQQQLHLKVHLHLEAIFSEDLPYPASWNVHRVEDVVSNSNTHSRMGNHAQKEINIPGYSDNLPMPFVANNATTRPDGCTVLARNQPIFTKPLSRACAQERIFSGGTPGLPKVMPGDQLGPIN